MKCLECGTDRGYLKHYEAQRTCLKCHTKRYTKKSPEQKRVYGCIKANINQRFKQRAINKDIGIFRYLPYTLNQLVKHLESQFEPWMNWDNHGLYDKNRMTWQIDHIIPDSNFVYSSPTDNGFLNSWALSNLRPLESMANILKSNK
jgi:5-methylcytosine-specific restriction endonuclease McrA